MQLGRDHMITAVIVEDERVIRNGLLTRVPWQELEVDEVRVAEHADEVFELCTVFKPDIIVSDIKMPGMDGITLCRKLREQLPESQIIFVTGYSDKEYLKAAIDLHAISYVEKPVCIPEISNAVRNAVEQIKKSHNQKSVVLYSLFMKLESVNYPLTSDTTFCVFLLHLNHVKNSQLIKEDIMLRLSELIKKKDLHIMGEVINSTQIVFMVSGKRKIASDKIIAEDLFKTFHTCLLDKDVKWFVAVGKEVDSQEKVKESYQAALEALKCLSYKGWKCIAFVEEVPDKSKNVKLDRELTNSFSDAVMLKDKERALQILEKIYQQLLGQHAVLNNDVRYLYYTLNKVVIRANQTYHLGDARWAMEDSDTMFIDHAETLLEIHEYLCQMLIVITSREEDQKNTFICNKITDYILENYRDTTISITNLADYVYLTPTYLSNLFKKNIGITIGQYLVDVRIEHAKQYLKDPRLKLYQIAPLVGYEDANYFAKIFKKKTGITPSEYREKHLIE